MLISADKVNWFHGKEAEKSSTAVGWHESGLAMARSRHQEAHSSCEISIQVQSRGIESGTGSVGTIPGGSLEPVCSSWR